MDDTKAGQLPREQPRQIPVPPDRVHQRRHRSPERDCSDQSSLPDTRETACSARDPCPQQSASSNPPQQRQNHRCENPMKQSVFTQPRSLADIEPHPCLLYPRKRTLRNTVGAKHCWDVHFVPIVEIDPGRRTACKMGYSYASTCKPRLESGLSGIALLL